MNTKQIAGVVVFVLVFGVASNSLANHAFADSMKSNVSNMKLQQNTVSDKPEGKTDKANTTKSMPTNIIKSTNQINTVKTDSKVVKNISQIKSKHIAKTTNHSPTTHQVTTIAQKTSTISTTSKDTKVTTDKPENKNDKADTVKGTK